MISSFIIKLFLTIKEFNRQLISPNRIAWFSLKKSKFLESLNPLVRKWRRKYKYCVVSDIINGRPVIYNNYRSKRFLQISERIIKLYLIFQNIFKSRRMEFCWTTLNFVKGKKEEEKNFLKCIKLFYVIFLMDIFFFKISWKVISNLK